MTDIILNQLYPGGVMKQLADAAGGVVYDQYAAGGCVGQLYAATGADVTLDQYAAGGPLHQIELEIEEGGGGSGLDWVPENAVIHIDLVRAFNALDAAWTAADGIVAVDTLLGNDANTENAWSVTAYTEADLTEDGLIYSAEPPALIGAARALALTGTTMTVKVAQVGEDANSVSIYFVAADGNDAVGFDFDHSNERRANISSYGGDLSFESDPIVNRIAGALNIYALTLTDVRAELAADGVQLAEETLASNDRPPGNPLVAALIDATTLAIQSITLYDALPSTAGLSAKSVTGVTNTAPHDLEIAWEAAFAGGNYTFDPEVTGDTNVSTSLSAIDDEGNPLVPTLVDDDGGKFVLVNTEFGMQSTFVQAVTIEDLTVGEHSFTIRATDPGGLYVEQEFTITVTA